MHIFFRHLLSLQSLPYHSSPYSSNALFCDHSSSLYCPYRLSICIVCVLLCTLFPVSEQISCTVHSVYMCVSCVHRCSSQHQLSCTCLYRLLVNGLALFMDTPPFLFLFICCILLICVTYYSRYFKFLFKRNQKITYVYQINNICRHRGLSFLHLFSYVAALHVVLSSLRVTL